MSVSVVISVWALAAGAAAQSFTFQGGATAATVRIAPDFPTTVIGDPWDFSEASDHLYMFSAGWLSGPSVSNGRLTGTAGVNPTIQLQFEGVNGALNIIGRNGVVYPIDPALYNRLSFRLSWSSTPPRYDTFETRWFQGTTRDAAYVGGRLSILYEFDDIVGRYSNQSPIASQSAPGYHIFKRDLDGARTLRDFPTGTAWTQYPVVRGLSLRLAGASVSGTTIDVDWVRLSRRGTATVGLTWSGLGAPVALTATNAATGDVVQIFPDNGTAASTFADNSSFTWDYGFLPAGTWTVRAAGAATSRQITLTIKDQPIVKLTRPDASGGRDFATTVAGDPWDLSSPLDVSRFYGYLLNMTGQTFSANGLHAASTTSDPALYLMDDSSRPAGTAQTIDASVYRHLTFTVAYDNKGYRWDASGGFQWDLGGVARVIWRGADHNGLPLTNTQDIVVLDGGPQTYSMDLATFTKFGDSTCADCALESIMGQDLWQGRIALLRIDPLEPRVTQGFRIANVKLAADDEPDASGLFPIKWTSTDPQATVTLYYDTDRNPGNGRTLIASALSAGAGQYNWLVAGVPIGRYWIYAEITDAVGNTQGRYSTGPIRISSVVGDSDGDGLPDAWEVQFGLNPLSAAGDNGANGDPDHDGKTNLEEYQAGTHPRGLYTRYFAEGATGFFDCYFALANPDPAQTAHVLLRFLRDDGVTLAQVVAVPPLARRTVVAKAVPGLASASFSTVVDSDVAVVADRTMTWDGNGYGSHAEGSIAAPATTWYLAEGATFWNFDLYYCLQNPSATQDAEVEITYLRPAPQPPVVRTYTARRNSRTTIWVDGEAPELANTDVSAKIVSRNGVPIIVERAMYLSLPGQFWGAGHESAGVTAPALEWFLAEGATGAYFDLYYLLCNPNAQPAQVTITYMPEHAPAFAKSYTVAANSRATVFVNGEDSRLTDDSLSARVTVTNGVPIIVERAMWWPGPSATTWQEAHNSPGLTTTGTKWALADGEMGGPRAVETYIVMANTAGTAGQATITLLFEDGTPSVATTVALPANSRTTVYPPALFPSQLPAGSHRTFGAIVESVGANPVPIVVERAMYNDALGIHWAAGTGAAATKLQ